MDIIDEIVFYLAQQDHNLLGIMASVERKANPDLKTPTRMICGREGVTLEYSPTLLEGLKTKGYGEGQVKNPAIQVLSEIMHLALLHPARRKALTMGKDKAADLACDLSVFDRIAHENPAFPQPQDHGLPGDLAAEQYYMQLCDQQDQQPQGGGGGGGGKKDQKDQPQDGDGKGDGKTPQDHSGWGDVPDVNQQTVREKVQAYAEKVAKSQGTDPLGIARLFNLTKPPKEPWHKILARVVGHKFSQDKKKFTVKRFSRRMGVPFPGKKSIRKGEIVVAVDTSGSIGGPELDKFIASLLEISRIWEAPIRFLVCDAAVHSDTMIRKVSDIPEMKGGGGTDFRPVFKAVENRPPQLLIFFTDLFGSFPEKKPAYDVIWASITKDHPVPFGTLFNIEIPDEKE